MNEVVVIRCIRCRDEFDSADDYLHHLFTCDPEKSSRAHHPSNGGER